jgi:hypothetical protein
MRIRHDVGVITHAFVVTAQHVFPTRSHHQVRHDHPARYSFYLEDALLSREMGRL